MRWQISSMSGDWVDLARFFSTRLIWFVSRIKSYRPSWMQVFVWLISSCSFSTHSGPVACSTLSNAMQKLSSARHGLTFGCSTLLGMWWRKNLTRASLSAAVTINVFTLCIVPPSKCRSPAVACRNQLGLDVLFIITTEMFCMLMDMNCVTQGNRIGIDD